MMFVLLHGSFGSPTEAWFPWLKEQLESLHHEVIAPQFPVDDWDKVIQITPEEFHSVQSLSSWMTAFDEVYQGLKHRSDICVVGHSMGTVFTLHIIERYSLPIKEVFFVAPFLYPATDEELKDKTVAFIDKANRTFYNNDFDFTRIRKHVTHSTVLYSDNDPYISENETLDFIHKMGSSVIQLSGLGHMGTEAGMKTFPQLLMAIQSRIITTR